MYTSEIEVWVNLPGFEDYYEISTKGQIKRKSKQRKRGFYKEKILPLRKSSYGYYEVVFHIDNKRYKFLLHRLLAMTFIPNPENKPEVNHKNGIRTDFNLENLEWCTRQENQKHKNEILKSHNKGERHPLAKLKESDIYDIHELYKKGWSMAELSRKYNVLDTTIFKIVKGITWAHLKIA